MDIKKVCYCCKLEDYAVNMSQEKDLDGNLVYVCDNDACHEYWATSVIGG